MARTHWLSTTGETDFVFSASTSVGSVREVNEDSMIAQPPVFLVADGMGGHAHGDAASTAAVSAFTRRISSESPWTPDAVLDAIRSAHEDIGALGSEIAGTTLTGVILVTIGAASGEFDVATIDPTSPTEAPEARYRWMVVNVGDSRVYHLDESGLRQITVDHSLVQEFVEQGLISSSEAMDHPDRNVITRALGVSAESVPDVMLLSSLGTHTFLICSDGVSGSVSLDALEAVLVQSPGSDDAAERVVQLALDAGSRDNVTAIVLEARVRSVRAPRVDDFEETQPRAETA